jgi:light-regulated signal transduction histidine kinase (bacteriophytochrome)
MLCCADPALVSTLKLKLAKLGYEVSAVATPSAPADATEFGTADLILLDSRNEDAIGLSDINTARSELEKVPVIHLISQLQSRAPSPDLKRFPFGHVVEPFSESDLHAVLQVAVERQTHALAQQEIEGRFRKEMAMFSAKVAHDLRAPLRHMNGFAQLALDRAKASGGETADYLVKIIKASAKMNELVDALRVWSEAGNAQLTVRRVDLQTLVASVTQDLMKGESARGIDWQIDKLPAVHADPSLLRQAIFNLLNNSLKFTRPRETAVIHIHSERDSSGKTELIIEDNGVGFDMQYVDKLFGVFQRLHHEREFEGVGISLAITRKIVERHGGKTWATSGIGKGAKFHLTLPSA